MKPRVLVTRPEPGLSATGRRLAAAGYVPILLPMTEIVALPVDDAPPGGIDAVLVTSANAARHLPRAWRAALRDIPVLAVGAATAEACQNIGFADVREGPGQARGLAEIAIAAFGKDARLLFLCGRVRLADAERELADAGARVVAVETYDARPVGYRPDEIDGRLGKEPIGAVLLYSREAALAYARLLNHRGLATIGAAADHLCLSARVASGLDGSAAQKIRIAGHPTEDALFALLPPQ